MYNFYKNFYNKMSFGRFDTLGLPIINNETMIRSTGGTTFNDSHLIINILINISIFLTYLLWFTLIFNISTRGWIDVGKNEPSSGKEGSDQQFLIFALCFTLFAIIFVYILLQLKKYF
jgi:hypothetical protein